MALVLLAVWGIPEAIVRLVNPPLEAFRALSFEGDPNSPKLFMKDWRLHWKLRPDVEIEFLNTVVRTDRNGFRIDKPSSGRRVVLCLGDSTTFGWRVESSESYPARLQSRLNGDNESGGPWQVLNAAVPGYSSFQVRLQAQRLIARCRPEVVIVCIGNNEAWPVERSDRQIDNDRTVTGRLVALLSRSRFLVWAAETLHPEKPQPFIVPPRQRAVPRVSRDEYEENLREIVRIAQSAGARVILLGPPVNLYYPPMRLARFPEMKQWLALYRWADQKAGEGHQQEVLDKVNAMLAENPNDFYSLWIKGIMVTARGDRDAGRALLEQALEHHPFPEGRKPSYREAIVKIAHEEKLSYVDINELFLRHTAAGTIPKELYVDWCHPTPQGHGFIADALLDAIAPKNGNP